MQNRVQMACDNMKKLNCCQSVLAAYADLVGLPTQDALRVAAGFGRGMGGQGEVCGAVSALVMLAGLKTFTGDRKQPELDKRIKADVAAAMQAFRELNGSVLCRELLEKRKQGGKSCVELVRDGALLAQEHLFPQE